MNIVVILIFILVICLFLIVIIKYKTKKEIYNKLSALGKVEISRKIYDYKLTTNNSKYLIKVLYNNPNFELSINSKNFWQYNQSKLSNKNGGHKIKNIYDLINYNTNDYIKVYIVYPSSKAIIRYINECELEYVKYNTLCHGVYICNFNEINLILL